MFKERKEGKDKETDLTIYTRKQDYSFTLLDPKVSPHLFSYPPAFNQHRKRKIWKCHPNM